MTISIKQQATIGTQFMKKQYLRSMLVFTVVGGSVLGLTACGSSNSSTSSGGNSTGEGFGMHEISGNQLMAPGEQIPIQARFDVKGAVRL